MTTENDTIKKMADEAEEIFEEKCTDIEDILMEALDKFRALGLPARFIAGFLRGEAEMLDDLGWGEDFDEDDGTERRT